MLQIEFTGGNYPIPIEKNHWYLSTSGYFQTPFQKLHSLYSSKRQSFGWFTDVHFLNY